MIGTIPVDLMNAGILLICLFDLWQMIHEKDDFPLLEASMDSHKQDMETFIPLPREVDMTKAI